jgi:hypothetical protein
MKSQGPNSHGDRLLLLKEVGDELRLMDKPVRHLFYTGQLQAYYIAGRRLRVKRSDPDQFLTTQLRST